MKIVLISTQRSGSTLVCDDFAGTQKLGKPTEHYLELLNKSSIREIQDYLKVHATSENGVLAVKIMANQLEKIDKLYENAGGKPYCSFFNLKVEKPYKFLFEQYKKASFIRVFREDKVAQAVSLIFSERTDFFHLVDNSEKLKGLLGKETTDKNIREVTFDYDREEIERRLGFIRKNEAILDEFCEAYRLKPTIIKYEEIIENNNYIFTMAENLGIDGAEPSNRTLMKIGGSSAKHWIDTYKNEVKNN